MPRGQIISQEAKQAAVAAIKGGSTAAAEAKKLGCRAFTVEKWLAGRDIGKRGTNGSGKAHKPRKRKGGKLDQGHASELAQREAIAYLRHARDQINEELRDGRIKKLSQAHLLTLLALEALGGS